MCHAVQYVIIKVRGIFDLDNNILALELYNHHTEVNKSI